MKKLAWCAVLTAVMAGILLFGIYIYIYSGGGSENAGLPLSFQLASDGETVSIRCWEQDEGHCFVFLPSYAEMEQVQIRLRPESRAALDGAALSDGMGCGGFAPDTEYVLTAGNRAPTALRFVRSANVAAMFIDTASGSMKRVHADKHNKEYAEILLYTADGAVDYRTTQTDRIRGRGNSTWVKEKKPYNLYLGEASALLGMGAAANWALLANAYDETNLKNKLIYDFAGSIAPYPGFAPRCEFVDLYVNGTYNGLYLLSEKAEAAENRLEITENDVLFCLDQEVNVDNPAAAIALDETLFAEIEYPDHFDRAALERRLREFNEALRADGGAGKRWADQIDLDSWVIKYLIEEIFLNADSGQNSQYFFWRAGDGKLCAGPCWDYDLTFGNSLTIGTGWVSPRCFWARRKQGDSSSWYFELWSKPEFRAAVSERYERECLPKLALLLDSALPETAARIARASGANRIRWASGGEADASAAIESMSAFLAEHILFLNSAWLEGEDYCEISFQAPEEYGARPLYVLRNTVCAELPSPEDLGMTGALTWYRADTGAPFDAHAAVTEDLTLYAVQSRAEAEKREKRETRLYVSALSLLVVCGLFLTLAAVDLRRGRQEGGKPR